MNKISLGNQVEINSVQHTPKRESVTPDDKLDSKLLFTKIFYIIGSLISVGIIFFIAKNWATVEPFSRIVATLGMGLLLSAIGSVLLRPTPDGHVDVGTVFHTIGGVLIPIGVFVTLFELGANTDSFWTMAFVTGFMFVFYLVLSFVHHRTIIYFFTIAHGTGFIYLLTEALTQNLPQGNLYAYLNIVVGVIYVLLGYIFRNYWNSHLLGMLYIFGSIGVYGFGFTLLFGSPAWEIVYPLFVLLGAYLSTRVKSLAMLVISSVALMAYLGYMSKTYLVSIYGWPMIIATLSLIFLILVYLLVKLEKKMIQDHPKAIV